MAPSNRLLRLSALALLGLTFLLAGRTFSAEEPLVAPAAPCNVSGFISVDTTWSPAGCDPYIATGSIIVNSGVTLTVQAGTTVKFDSLRAMTVNGTLVARGTVATPITFTSNLAIPAKGDWSYIHFTDTSIDAMFDGGGNYLNGSILQYAVVEYGGGTSIGDDGAIRIQASSPYIDHNTIRNNKADGVHVWFGIGLRITNNTVTGNGIVGLTSATGILVSGSGMSIVSDNTVSSNATWGVYIGGDAGTVSGNTITNHSQSGIYVYTGAPTITNNTITGNSAGNGGGIYVFSDSAVTIIGNTITGNSASNGGGIYGQNGTLTIIGNTITGNSAATGGGIYIQSSTPIISNNTISGNSADSGGGLYLNNCSTSNSISGNAIINNTATQANRGGGIYLIYGCNSPLNNNDLYGNMTGSSIPNDLYNGDPAGSPDLNAENNYWGVSDCNAIEDLVYHFIDDGSLGIVDYFPCATVPFFGGTPTPTSTPTQTNTSGPSLTPTPTPTASNTPTITPTPTVTPTPTSTLTPSNTPTPSDTPTVTSTHTPGPSPTPTNTPAARLMLPALMRNYPPCFPGPSEFEPNDSSGQANGPLCSGQDYSGSHDDADDYFWFSLTTNGTFTVTLTSLASDTQLLLYYPSTDNLVAQDANLPYVIVCPPGPQGTCLGTAGTYYVRVFTGDGVPPSMPYTLRVTYP